VPKEECVCVQLHQFKPYMLASFTDGFVRVFELDRSAALGRIDMGNVSGTMPEASHEK